MPNKPPTAKSPYASLKGFPTAQNKHGKGGESPELRAMYKTAVWLRVRACCQSLNPMCQRLIGDEQCHASSKLAHHIVSPRVDPSKFLNWENILMVCASHHPRTAGEPVDSDARYVLTHGLLGATFDANELLARLRNGRSPAL